MCQIGGLWLEQARERHGDRLREAEGERLARQGGPVGVELVERVVGLLALAGLVLAALGVR